MTPLGIPYGKLKKRSAKRKVSLRSFGIYTRLGLEYLIPDIMKKQHEGSIGEDVEWSFIPIFLDVPSFLGV